LYALSLLSLVRISSNKRTLNNFGGLVDSEGRFKDHIHEFSNARVAASPHFSWFCKLLQRETQGRTLSGTAFLRTTVEDLETELVRFSLQLVLLANHAMCLMASPVFALQRRYVNKQADPGLIDPLQQFLAHVSTASEKTSMGRFDGSRCGREMVKLLAHSRMGAA